MKWIWQYFKANKEEAEEEVWQRLSIPLQRLSPEMISKVTAPIPTNYQVKSSKISTYPALPRLEKIKRIINRPKHTK